MAGDPSEVLTVSNYTLSRVNRLDTELARKMGVLAVLDWKPRRRSTLEQHEYVVTQRRCPGSPAEDGECALSVWARFVVQAPDPVQATVVVRSYTEDTLMPGWHYHTEPGTVRQVTYGWGGHTYNAPVVKVCEAY